MTRRAVLIGLVLGAAAFLAVECAPGNYYDWDGGYHLTVHVETASPPPTWVVLYPVGQRDVAERWCSEAPGPSHFEPGTATTVRPPAGVTQVGVRIQTGGRETALLGRELARYQERYLLVAAEWPDGRRSCRVVDIPDGRESREVRVPVW